LEDVFALRGLFPEKQFFLELLLSIDGKYSERYLPEK
jgi:hypothetical protein